jgi:N-acetyltransferase
VYYSPGEFTELPLMTLDPMRVEPITLRGAAVRLEPMARIGATEEGTFRKHVVIERTGRVRDTVYFSIIDSEWPDVKERLEATCSPARNRLP